MAEVALSMGSTDRTTSPSSTATRRRYVAPTRGAPTWYRIFCASDLYLERVDATDESARGDDYETLPGGQVHVVAIRRGEFALSCAASSAAIEVTALSRVGGG